MEEIVEILMRRDGLSRTEAWNLIDECIYQLRNCNYIYEAEDIVMDILGLEPDYLDVLMDEMM